MADWRRSDCIRSRDTTKERFLCNFAMSRLLLLVALAVFTAYVANGHGHGQPPTFECEEDGIFVDIYRDCQVFYHCEDGVQTTSGCHNGYRYDLETYTCRPPTEVSCPYPGI
ncbi:uncharacterized protein LOC119585669 [Penaeus monodon]|uniref:uncharacterized protein LOC119585669 n=1 Tax=Penaeus monodon TaxID=6687 RepID=UPI0018A7B536|nr:uncharacterized protein LOC119585669 [Penaeus monodon]